MVLFLNPITKSYPSIIKISRKTTELGPEKIKVAIVGHEIKNIVIYNI